MSKVLTSSNRFLMSGGRWLTREYVPPEPPPPPPVTRYVYLNQTTGGTISASPMSGVDGDTVTLSNTPSTNYTFNGYSVNGATLYSGNKFDFSGSDVTCSASWTLNLPPYTIRLKYQEGVTPTFRKGTAVQVSSSPNVWDLTYENSDWNALLMDHTNLLEVIDANSTGVSAMYSMFAGCTSLTSVPLFDTSSVTNMYSMFYLCYGLTSVPLFDTSSVTKMDSMFAGCNGLTSVPLFDTSSVTDMGYMFYSCDSLTSVPLFDTSSVTDMAGMFQSCDQLVSVPLFDTSSATNMSHMFRGCYKVESGALALYQQASTQATVPSHLRTFEDCGSNTVTGAAELAKIPADWK